MKEDLSDYYIKIGVGSEFANELSNVSYLLKELKKNKNNLNQVRQRKAEIRKELYETLIGLRLNVDKLKAHLPAHEAERLSREIAQISSYHKRKSEKKPLQKKYEQKKLNKKPEVHSVKKAEPKKPAKKREERVEALSSEKRELELLKQDLENISKELKKRK